MWSLLISPSERFQSSCLFGCHLVRREQFQKSQLSKRENRVTRIYICPNQADIFAPRGLILRGCTRINLFSLNIRRRIEKYYFFFVKNRLVYKSTWMVSAYGVVGIREKRVVQNKICHFAWLRDRWIDQREVYSEKNLSFFFFHFFENVPF